MVGLTRRNASLLESHGTVKIAWISHDAIQYVSLGLQLVLTIFVGRLLRMELLVSVASVKTRNHERRDVVFRRCIDTKTFILVYQLIIVGSNLVSANQSIPT